MTDEEMAEESLISYRKESKWAGKVFMRDENTCYKDGFLAGLKAGKDMNVATKWHKVADGDLPKDENDVLVYSGEDWRMCVGKYFPKYKSWEAGCDTIAWMEIPEPPKEESK